MTKEELYLQLAAGNNKVQSMSDAKVGIVQEINLFGSKYVCVSVLFEGERWNTIYSNNEESRGKARSLNDLKTYIQ